MTAKSQRGNLKGSFFFYTLYIINKKKIIIIIAINGVLRSRLYKITKKHIKNTFSLKKFCHVKKNQYLCTRFKKLIKRKEKYYEQT